MSIQNSITSKFTVIIVNYNGGDLLKDCVLSITKTGLAAHQIIIVDNGSKDSSIALLLQSTPGCKIIKNGCNAGFSKAVNKGLFYAKTDYSVLVNNDAQLDINAFNALHEAFENHPRAAFLGGRLLNLDGSFQNSIAPFPRLLTEIIPRPIQRMIWPSRTGSYHTTDTDIPVESVIGALFSIRMTAIPSIGFLDEDFFFFLEETEWCYRAWQKNWEVWHVPAARATHIQGATAKKFSALARIEFHRSRLKYFKKTKPNIYQIILIITWIKSISNTLSNSIAVLITLGLSKKILEKSIVYWRILIWYLNGRPEDVGLPDKCIMPATPRSK